MEKIIPENWSYIVRSKTGKMYPYTSLEAAQDAAKRKSTRSTYSVWHDGKFIEAYAKNKLMPSWHTLYCKKMERDEEDYNHYKKNTWNGCPTPYEAFHMVYDYSVDTCDEKIRVKIRHWVVTILPNGKKKPEFKSETLSIYNSGRIVYSFGKNIVGTNHMYIDDPCVREDVMKVLYKEMLRRKPEMKQILENCRDINELIDGYTHPNSRFITDDYKHLIRRREFTELNFSWFPNKITNESDIIPAICKKLRIPCTKRLKKMYFESTSNLILAKYIVDMGFRDVNNILKLPDAGMVMCHTSMKERPYITKITRKFIRRRTENWLANAILNEGLDGIRDTARMIAEGRVDERIVDFAVEGSRNIHEFHDTIMANYSAKPRKTKAIKYTSAEKARFNRSYDDCKFELAIDNYDLAIIGAKMGICVGSYSSVALSRRATIVKLMRDNSYIACIEIRDNNVIQIKARFNNPVQIEYKQVIDKWLEEAKLNVECCGDYERIGESWYSTYNYAHVNPNEFVERPRHQRTLEIVKACPYIHTNYVKWYKKVTPTITEHQTTPFEPVEELPFEPVEEFELPF